MRAASATSSTSSCISRRATRSQRRPSARRRFATRARRRSRVTARRRGRLSRSRSSGRNEPRVDDHGPRTLTTMTNAIRIPAAALRSFCARLFATAGCSTDEADAIAGSLVQTNLYGHDSHGVGLVPTYLRNLQQRLVNAGVTPRVVTDAGPLVGLDAQKGFGQIAGAAAMRIAIERARTHGIALVGLANTHHLGRIGQWAEQCAQAGFASVHFVNALSTPLVAPWGGIAAKLSTNPFCVGVPHAPHPVVLDYATSAIAYGKVRVACEEGRRLAPGVLIGAQGS